MDELSFYMVSEVSEENYNDNGLDIKKPIDSKGIKVQNSESNIIHIADNKEHKKRKPFRVYSISSNQSERFAAITNWIVIFVALMPEETKRQIFYNLFPFLIVK